MSDSQVLMGFVASCIEDVAHRLGIDYSDVYRRMDNYLIPFYSTLHTESRENLTDSLIDLLQRRENAND